MPQRTITAHVLSPSPDSLESTSAIIARWIYARPEKSGVAGHEFNIAFKLHYNLHFVFDIIMATSVHSRLLLRASRAISLANGRCSAIYNTRRSLADVANDDMTLPLKNLKVLDMTRVLAGVSF